MNSGPRTRSRSRTSRAWARQNRRPAATVAGRLPIATVALTRHDLLHLVLGPGDGLLGGSARHRLGDHVRQDVGVGDELYLVGRWRRPAVGVVLDTLALEGGVLGIGPEDGMVLQLLVDRQVEGVARHDVLVVHRALAEQVADPLLRRVDVLRELPDRDVPRGVRLVTAAGSAEAPVVVDTVGRDELPLLGDDVGAHRVVDPAGLALLDRLVVAGVRP